MLSTITLENAGTCFVCHETVDIDHAMHHLKICGVTPVALKTEQVFIIKVSSCNEFWMFVEAAGDTTLKSLYLFLRSNWFECCGHMSEFFVDGASAETDYMDKTLSEMLSFGKTFHYAHTGNLPARVVGEVVAVKSSLKAKDMSLLLRKIIPEERCNTCIETTKQ
jgi:hypothetical protein